MINSGRKSKISLYILEAVMIIIAIIVIIPIYYLLVTTFKTPAEAAFKPLGLPHHIIFDNYIKAWKGMSYPRVFANSLFITSLSVIILVVLSSAAAYTIARRENMLNKFLYLLFLAGIMVPFQMAVIPLYKLTNSLGMINRQWGVVILDSFCVNMPFSIFLFRGFIKTLPVELEEAAFIDGSSVLNTYLQIILPLLKPVVATVAILNSLGIWNDFFTPLLFLQSKERYVIWQAVYGNIGQFSTDWTSFFPMMMLGVAPLLIFYIFMQKFIIKGVIAGSLKG